MQRRQQRQRPTMVAASRCEYIGGRAARIGRGQARRGWGKKIVLVSAVVPAFFFFFSGDRETKRNKKTRSGLAGVRDPSFLAKLQARGHYRGFGVPLAVVHVENHATKLQPMRSGGLRWLELCFCTMLIACTVGPGKI